MAKRIFVVFGLGRFGESVATTLAESGCEVLAVDSDPDKVQEIASKVTHAVCTDVMDVEVLQSLGLNHFDAAVIGIGKNLEASIMLSILSKEMGVPFVLARAQTELHAKVLRKVGVDKVVFPEQETGIRIAHNLIMGNFFDAVELSKTFSLMDLIAPESWVGKNLRELNLRTSHGITVVGIRRGEDFEINPDPGNKIQSDDMLVVIGKNDVLNQLVTGMK